MRTFESLSEQEVLALAISLEEDDARIYEDFADGLKENYPEQAAKFLELQKEEDGHRHRLLDLFRSRARHQRAFVQRPRNCGMGYAGHPGDVFDRRRLLPGILPPSRLFWHYQFGIRKTACASTTLHRTRSDTRK